jgi:hypothetical protein
MDLSPPLKKEKKNNNMVMKVAKQNGPPRRSSVTYPRRRAVTACQVCRLRKTKCDNMRPSCGFCLRVNKTCIYDDESVDHSA